MESLSLACFILGGCGAEPTPFPSSGISSTVPVPTSSTALPVPVTGTMTVSLATSILSSSESSTSLQTSIPSSPSPPSAPASSSTSLTHHSCQCMSTGTIVGITLGAASTASVFTMLFILWLSRRNRRAPTQPTNAMIESFPASKKLAPSGIRETVILISPERENWPTSFDDTKSRRAYQFSQRSNTNTDTQGVLAPQLPAINLSPPLLTTPFSDPHHSPRSSQYSQYSYRMRTSRVPSHLSPPGSPTDWEKVPRESGARIRSSVMDPDPNSGSSVLGSDRTELSPNLVSGMNRIGIEGYSAMPTTGAAREA